MSAGRFFCIRFALPITPARSAPCRMKPNGTFFFSARNCFGSTRGSPMSSARATPAAQVSTKKPGTSRRANLCADINGEQPPHRSALICDAGLGKSTNMEWLQRQLAERGGRRLPLLLRLEDKHDQNLLMEERKLGQPSEALVHRLKQLIEDQAGGEQGRLVSTVRRLQAAGRITLLIDGLDHVADTEHMAGLIHEMLESLQWRDSPAWISGRPTAFETCWVDIFGKSRWQFYRVKELGEDEIRLYMTHNADGDWYDEFREVQNLLAIPRLLQLICKVIHGAVAARKPRKRKLAVVRNLKLRTPAEIYCRAFLHVGAADDPNDQGLWPRTEGSG